MISSNASEPIVLLAQPRIFFPPTAAYVHIPFCRRRCYYCDFPVSVIGDQRRGENSGTIAQYLTYLGQEIDQTPALGPPLQTVFFGGGTPSLLSVGQVAAILARLAQQFGLATEVEISMEMDPGTFDAAHAQGYRAAGVNRVSLGVQAFQAELLQLCGRTHGPADIPLAVALIQEAGIENWGMDLISGLPQQSLEQWDFSLEQAIALQPKHLSVYDLIVEPGTAFARRYRSGHLPLPLEETAAQMYRQGQRRLTAAGYEHYEISNYGQPGFACRHNRVYWENRPYYGFGMGAASYVQGQRFTRPRTRQQYFDWVQAGRPIDLPPETQGDRLLDTLMLGLRLADGVKLTTLEQHFGAAVVAQILTVLTPYQQEGLVEYRPDAVRLTDPEGFLLSNTVLTALFEQFPSDGKAG